MIKSNLKTAIRHIIKNKGLSAINIFGLSVSIAICLLSYLFISFEYSHDDFHKKGDRVYQVINHLTWKVGEPYYNCLQDYKIAAELKNSIPNIEYTACLRTCKAWIRHDNKKLKENIAFTDSSFFDIFTFDLIVGSKNDLLKSENDVLITQELADKLLKTEDLKRYSKLIGQTIEFPNLKDRQLTIRGVLKNVPKNSSIKFDLVVQYKHSANYSQSSNGIGNTSVYLCLNDVKNKNIVERTATANVRELYNAVYTRYIKEEEMVDDTKNFTLELLPFQETYLTDKIWAAYAEKGDKERSSILTYISILVLILACVNYVMLSVGISMKRFKEIAIKKVFGSKRRSIIAQLVTETSVTVFLSIIFGVVMAELSLPFFNNLTSYDIEFNLYTNVFAYSFLAGLFLIIVTTISIPGIYISKQNPVNIFRNQTKMGSRLGLAKSFIVIQFTLSLILIIASVFIVKQIHDMKTQEVGFNTDKVLIVNLPSDFKYSKKIKVQKRMNELNGVVTTCASDRNFYSGSSSLRITIDTTKVQSRILRIDTTYIKTLGLTVSKGRNLRGTDNLKKVNAVIVNETFVREAGLKHPLETSFKFWGYTVQIVGVIKDFHFDSMHRKIQPVICFNDTWIQYLFVKLKEGRGKQTISEMKDVWRDFDNERELSYSFLDDDLNKQYKNEEQISNIVTTITILALMISVFGLIGLTMLLLMQKIKEIGIRKINGASTWQILVLINKEFGKYLLLASLIAIPLSYYGLTLWLENFALKTDLNWWIFLASAMGLGVIVLLTISYKSMRAATKNPVNAIKYE